jgi:Ca-activated chloride channel family protein
VWAIALPLASLTPTPSAALEWQDLWLREDQQSVRDVEEGVELYRSGDYAGAAEKFAGESVVESYDRGNALAHAGELEEALASYDRALELDPEHENARFNRDLVEQLLQEQKQQQDQQGQNDEEQDSQQEGSQDQDESSDGSQDESGKQSNPDSSSDSQDGSQNGSQDKSSDDAQQDGEPSSPSPSDDSAADPSTADEAEAPSVDESKDDTPSEEDRAESALEPGREDPESDEPADAAQSVDAEQAPLSERSEQWLRNIPDDPGGLMRRKFQYEAEVRRQRETRGARPRPATRY